MSISIVQFKMIDSGASSTAATSYSATFTSNVTTGNYIVVFNGGIEAGSALGSATTASDGLGNAYTLKQDATLAAAGGFNGHIATFVAPVTTGGSCTVTGNWSRTMNQLCMVIAEISGQSASPYDNYAWQVQLSPGTGTDADTTGAATNSNAIALLLAVSWAYQNGGATGHLPAAGTGFTQQAQGWQWEFGEAGACFESQRVTSSASRASTWTIATSGSGHYINSMLMLDEASVLPTATIAWLRA